jgi:hypothetical protein
LLRPPPRAHKDSRDPAAPLLALQASASGQFLTERNQERLLSNVSGLQVSFLWGAASPSGIKQTTSCVVRTLKSVWLFECGEDTQRNLSRWVGPGRGGEGARAVKKRAHNQQSTVTYV